MNRHIEFCSKFGLTLPVLLAPMAGACPASLSIAGTTTRSDQTSSQRTTKSDAQRSRVSRRILRIRP